MTVPVEYEDNGVTVLYEFSETLSAVQTYAVTLHANGGEIKLANGAEENADGLTLLSEYYDDETHEAGYYVTLPEVAGTRQLYEFDGWSLTPMGERYEEAAPGTPLK